MMPVSFSELHTTMLFHSNNTNNNNQRTNTSTTLVPPPPPPPPEHHCSDYNDSSISTASDISQAQDDYLKINTPGSNYDISYYFDPSASSATTAYQKSDSEEEEEDNNINENISINRSNTSLPYRSRSLSIGSTVSTHYMNNSSTAQTTATAFNEYYPPGTPSTTKTHTTTTTGPIEPIYTTYTDKSDRSNKKAHQFFGEQVKLQVTAKEVRKEGLKALLYSTAPLGYFLYHLLNEYSSENLFFYLAVDNYQNYNFPNHLERQQVANKIAKAYLTRNSELEVNLEDRISRAVKKALLEQQRQPSLSTGNEFDAAKRHVFSLLNVSYHRFRVSSIWDIMEAKCEIEHKHLLSMYCYLL
ncbi:RGS domain-containing protein [Pilaira anomala]|nr:RGS domain-containing protein [Pilaira anomala]KAI9360154.1 RGS domain-containing protein [Pilaira anomala]